VPAGNRPEQGGATIYRIACIAMFALAWATPARTDDTVASREILAEPIAVGMHGTPYLMPESTFAGFREAVIRGAGGLWVEVRQTADGCLVAFPSDRLDVNTEGCGRVDDTLYDELLTLDAGFYAGPGTPPQRIPLLKDVLRFASDNSLWLVLDVKIAGASQQIRELINETGKNPRVRIWGLAAESGPGAFGGRIRFLQFSRLADSPIGPAQRFGETTFTICLSDDREQLSGGYVRGLDLMVTPFPSVFREIALARKRELPGTGKGDLRIPPVLHTDRFDEMRKLGVDALAEKLSSDDAQEARLAAVVLGRGFSAAEAGAAVHRMLVDGSADARRRAALAAGLLGLEDAVPALAGLLISGDSRTRADTALALSRIATSSAWSALARCAERERDPAARCCAIKGLAAWPDRRAVFLMRQALRIDNPSCVRACGAMTIGLAQEPQAIDDLYDIVSLGKDAESEIVRDRAAWALGLLGQQAAPVLLKGLKSDDEKCRMRSAWALVRMGNEALPTLRFAFRDPSPAVRRHAAIIYGWIGNPEADYLLTGLVDDEFPDVRAAAAWALGMCRSVEGGNLIARRLAEKEEPKVHQAMIEALGRIRKDDGKLSPRR